MNSSDLPGRDSSDVHLVPATLQEWLECQRMNSVEWKGPLTIDSYLGREYNALNQDLIRDGGLTGWVLVWQKDSSEERKILCSCETMRKRAFVARNGVVEEVVCHAVAAVFCPEESRGRGLAGRMMTDLGERLRSYQGKSAFSVLFSDIGKAFYAARGWQPFPSAQIEPKPAVAALPAGVQLLYSEDLPELCATDERLLRERLEKTESDQRTVVAVIPELATALWHYAKEEFVSMELNGKIPKIKGAIAQTKSGNRVFAYWKRDFADPKDPDDYNELHVLRIVVEDNSLSDLGPATTDSVKALQSHEVTKTLSDILAVAQNEAAQWDMKRVLIWNPTSATLAAAQQIDPNVTVEHRETRNIPSLRWYGDSAWKDIDWVYNEKYGWC